MFWAKKIDWVEKWKKVHTPWQKEALSGEDNTELLLFQWPLNFNLCHGIPKLVHCCSVIHANATWNTYRHIYSCHSFLFWTCLFFYFCSHHLTLLKSQYRQSWCVLRHVFIKSSWVPHTNMKTNEDWQWGGCWWWWSIFWMKFSTFSICSFLQKRYLLLRFILLIACFQSLYYMAKNDVFWKTT